MKVHIGKYKNWFGPYQFTQALFRFLSEEKQDKIAEKLPLAPFERLDNLRGERKIKVHIDDYDVWNMDNTLAHIIVPMLKKLKKEKKGAPHVDDEDVPNELKSLSSPPKENEYDIDDNHFKRWDWIVDEMIWAFEQKVIDNWEEQYYSGEHDVSFKETDDGILTMEKGPKDTFKVDVEGLNKHQDRMKNGFRLFGKYYEGLWA